jgi:hypothetical protein
MPFCGKLIRYRDKIKAHIGQHQKQIDLMALSNERGFQAVSDHEDSDEEPDDQPVPLLDYLYQTASEAQQPPITTGAHDITPELHTDIPERQSESSEDDLFVPKPKSAMLNAGIQSQLRPKGNLLDR